MEKTLTIIVPSYNSEAFLKKCLESFLVAEDIRGGLEVIIVNDGSTDGTQEVAEGYCNKYPDTFRVIRKENGGHGSAINTGAAAAAGTYLKIIDADDWVNPKELEKYLKFLANAESDVVFNHYVTYNIATGEQKKYTVEVPAGETVYTLDTLMQDWSKIEWGTTFHGIAYKTSFYQACGYQLTEKVFYEDQEYATMPCCRAQSIQIADCELYVYRIGDVTQSVSAENQVKRLGHFEQVISNMLAKKPEGLSTGGELYWEKKVSMCITSYYEIALLKNKNYRAGRKRAAGFNRKIKELQPEVYQRLRKKYLVFWVLNQFHVEAEQYEKWWSEIKRRWT